MRNEMSHHWVRTQVCSRCGLLVGQRKLRPCSAQQLTPIQRGQVRLLAVEEAERDIEKTTALIAKAKELQAEFSEILLMGEDELSNAVLRFESRVIRLALESQQGSVTRAAKVLKTSYQNLTYVIETRHKELNDVRTPIIPRGKAA